MSGVAKALGLPHRLEPRARLGRGGRCVDSGARLAGIAVGNASQHVRRLYRAGLLDFRRDGKHVLYRLADEAVVDVLSALRRIAERNVAEVQKLLDGYFRERDSLEPVSHDELIKRMRSGSVTLLDVRPAEEFAAGHLPGAINIPLRELEKRLQELSPRRDIVAYCRGPYCVLSFEAVAALRGRGFAVRRLVDGYPEWKAAGRPVETALTA